jgi:hypothetical protein
MKKLLFISIIIIAFIACENNEEKYKLLVGHWQCSDWTVAGDSTNKCIDSVYFVLNEDKTYRSVLGSAKESGDYKINGDRVVFSPDGKPMDIPVRILQLNSVYFEFMMNRGGTEEIITLKKRVE